MADKNVPPPLFSSNNMSAETQAAVAAKGTPSTLNLDDIFGDVVFTPDGDTVFLSEDKATTSGQGDTKEAARIGADGTAKTVAHAGGLYTTHLMDGAASTAMGAASEGVQATPSVGYKAAPQKSNHLQYAAPKKKKEGRSSDRKMSEQQKVERR